MEKKIKYMQFPLNGGYREYSKFPKDTLRLPIVEGSTYDTYPLNQHHFKPFFHIEYVLPALESLLHFGYKRDDFDLVEQYDGEFDVSYLAPKKEYVFDTLNLTDWKKVKGEGFDGIRKDTTDPVEAENITPYHRLYAFPHRCSGIINRSIDSDRRLVLSCDSNMIPTIPVLCCYFKEVWVYDNRDGRSLPKIYMMNMYKEDTLIVGGFNKQSKYLIDNFR